MNPITLLAYAAAAVAFLCVVSFTVRSLRTYFRFRGKHLITCPETHKPAAVDVNLRRAVWDAFHPRTSHLRLADCSRWPDRADCPQDCVPQIEVAPKGTRVLTIVKDWYATQTCTLCGKPIRDVDWLDDWLDHEPGLLDSHRLTAQWNELPPETLPELFDKLKPLCWNCHVAERFRREFPDLVVDRRPH